MKLSRIIINGLLFLGIILSTYFLYLSMTPEGYTGIFIWFKYNVHTPLNPAIFISLFVVLMVAFNWKIVSSMRNKLQLAAMFLAAMVLLGTVFFFLAYKRHNRLPWERPNVILIVVDTLRADYVSAYGHNKASTPNMDALADDGWLFEHAYSHIPITMPSHSSLFSGRMPHDVWVLNNRNDYTYPKPTLAEILKSEGYKTAAFVSLGVLRKNFHLSRGFDFYDDRLPRNGQWYNRADVITDRGIEWLENNAASGDPFFMWIHYSDPHEPYNPPDSPPDISIELNGVEVISGSIDSAATINAPLELNPGENTITIKRLVGPKSRVFLTRVYFSGVEEGPFPQQWVQDLKNARRIGGSNFRQALRRFQQQSFLSDFNDFAFAGLRFREGHGWERPEAGTAKARRAIERETTFTVVNESDEKRLVTLHLKGGLNKDIASVLTDYKHEVEYVDSEIGKFLDYLKQQGLMDNTIVILLSDHGEELNEHGLIGHIQNLYTQSLHIPLIIRDPDADRRGTRVSGIARIIDVAPTILDMIGLHKPTYMQGRTLLEYITRHRSPGRPSYAETFQPEARDNKVALLENNWIGIYSPEVERLRQLELYNLEEDRNQWRNTALSSAGGRLNEFAGKMKNFWESMSLDHVEREIDDDRREMLEDLGYLTRTAVPSLLNNRGVPAEEVLDNVRNAMQAYYAGAIDNLVVEAKSTGNGDADRMSYISITVTLPADADDTHVVSLQGHITLTVSQQSRQFPIRLAIYVDQTLVFDKMFPGDPVNIVRLYSLRLFRLLLQQPWAATLSPAFERLFPRANEILEKDVGLQN